VPVAYPAAPRARRRPPCGDGLRRTARPLSRTCGPDGTRAILFRSSSGAIGIGFVALLTAAAERFIRRSGDHAAVDERLDDVSARLAAIEQR
jgi:hypothetical protein